MTVDLASYSIRTATMADAETMARYRALMFQDMGSAPNAEAETEHLFAASAPWFRSLLARGEYAGWFAVWRGETGEEGDEIVAGGGIHLREMGPVPGCCRVGRSGHIANIYTVPAHRRRGLARLLMETMLEWSESIGLDQVTLSASSDGRPLYSSLGFRATPEMMLPVRRISVD
ncbi:GNAT family N-acetyltransferase [Tunturiibacter empetritectus]|nr:GNAT family N-acetyltransferase [Edaphobacter lichenicola]